MAILKRLLIRNAADENETGKKVMGLVMRKNRMSLFDPAALVRSAPRRSQGRSPD